MSIVYYNNEILDRKTETNEILSFIKLTTQKNKVLFVCGNTGVGKTTIVKNALKHYTEKDRIIIQVETPPLNQIDCIVQGEYLRLIVNSVNEEMKPYDLSLYDFFLSIENPRLRGQELGNLIGSDLSKLPQTLLGNIINKYFRIGVYDTDKVIYDLDTEANLLKKEYLRYLFKQQKILLFITNFQNMDFTTVRIINDLIVNTKRNIFILEYTNNNDDYSDVYKYHSNWAESSEIATEIVDMLPVNIAINVGGKNICEDITEWNTFYINVLKGNLYKTIAYKHQHQNDTIHDPMERISYLGISAIIILQIIQLHGGEISLEKIDYLLNNSSPELFLYWLNKKRDLSLYINVDSKKVKIIHSSVCDFLSNSNNSNIHRAGFLAYGIIRNVLSKDLSKDKYIYYSKKEILLLLIKVYAGYDSEKLLYILARFKEVIINEIAIEQINYLFEQSITLINDNNKQIILSLIKLFYDIGLYNKAFELVKTHEFSCLDFFMYKAILLNRLDMHEDCVNYCKSMIRKSDNKRFRFSIQLIELLSLKTLKCTSEYTTLYYELLNNNDYKEIFEYGFLLRVSEIVMSSPKDIKYIEQSVRFFRDRKSKKNEIYSVLTLATEMAYNNHIEHSRQLLLDIKNDFLDTTTEKHIIYNDLAALDLIEEKPTINTKLLLEESMLISRNSYDTLTIMSNIICWHLINNIKLENDVEFFKELSNHMAIEPDQRIHRRILFNLYQYYKVVEKNKNKEKEMWEKMELITGTIDEHLDRLIKSEINNKDGISFYPSFITYWHFDIPMIEWHY